MSPIPSTMVPLDTEAPDFELPDTDGNSVSLGDFEDAPGLLVIFMCNHCPYVKHIREELAEFAAEYQEKGLAIVGINANDPERYPDDSPEAMVREVEEAGYTFPYLFDETQEVARAYNAACTPDFFLYDIDRRLVYRGQFDSSRPGNKVLVTGEDLREAADAVLEGRTPSEDQMQSVGCGIKWKDA
jgi:peroxiredoxin